MSTKLPTLSPCEAQNLAQIQASFGGVLLLSVEQLAQLINTTANNVAQLLRRGHVPFNTVRLGARVFFPVPLVASWLCGQTSDAEPLSVPLPTKTPLRVRSSADLKARLAAVRALVEQRAQALREADDAQGFKEAREAHAHASSQVVALVEREALRKRAGLALGVGDSAL